MVPLCQRNGIGVLHFLTPFAVSLEEIEEVLHSRVNDEDLEYERHSN